MDSFSLAEMVLTQQMLHTEATACKGLTLLVRVDDRLPDPLCGDADSLRELLQRLINHAIERTHEGLVELTVSTMERSGSSWQVRFCVRDTGPCLVREQCTPLGLLWGEPGAQDLFFPEPSYDPNELAQCAGMVMMLFGCPLFIHSTAESTRIQFELMLEEPVSAPSHADEAHVSVLEFLQEPEPEHELGLLHGIRILLVEDSPLTQAFALKRLQDAGADVIAVESGEAALMQLEHQAFDVMLLDLLMPGTDGYAIARQIRALGAEPLHPAQADLAALPIVGMNLVVGDAELYRVYEVGMDGLISKPVQPAAVLHALREACGLA